MDVIRLGIRGLNSVIALVIGIIMWWYFSANDVDLALLEGQLGLFALNKCLQGIFLGSPVGDMRQAKKEP